MDNGKLGTAKAAPSNGVDIRDSNLMDLLTNEIKRQVANGTDDQNIVVDLRDKQNHSQDVISAAMTKVGWGKERVVAAFYGEEVATHATQLKRK